MIQNLYFVRHAIAIDHGTPGVEEEKRFLTKEGIKKMIEGVQGMSALKIKPGLLLSSPFVRAYQTAEILKRHLPFSGEIELENSLKPGGSLKVFLKRIADSDQQEIMLVGHEPTMSSWIEELLAIQGSGTILLKKGALAHLEIDRSMGTEEIKLVTLLQPKALRLIGQSN